MFAESSKYVLVISPGLKFDCPQSRINYKPMEMWRTFEVKVAHLCLDMSEWWSNGPTVARTVWRRQIAGAINESWQSGFRSDVSGTSTSSHQQEIEKREYEEQILALRARRNAADTQLEGLLQGWETKFGAKYAGLEDEVGE